MPREKVVEEQEMMRSAARILANGGTKADVADYFYRGYGVRLAGYQPPVEKPGPIRGYAMSALNGLTFGFGDEAVGSIIGLLTGEGAQGGRDDYRAELQKFGEANPVSSTIAEVGGAALLTPLMGPAGLTGAGTSMGGRVATGAAVGGAAGAGFGAGTATGGLSERAKGAVVGGTLGAATGGALPVVGAVAGTVTKPVGRQFASWTERLRGAPKGTTASKAAREMVAEAIARDYGGSLEAAIREAERMIRTGAPVTLADIMKQNGDDLIKAATALRGPGKQRVVEEMLTRQADQGERIISRLFRSLKLGAENAYDAADDIMAGRKAAATPLYEQAFTQEAKVTPELAKLLSHPRFQKAYEYGRLIAADEDLAGVANKGALKVPPLAVDKNGKFVGQTIPVRALDYMKRGLDATIEQAGKSGAEPLDRQHARALRALLNKALDEVADVPEYVRARGVWKGETEMLEALQLGKGGAPLAATEVRTTRFVNKPPEVIRREMASLGPSEQELYKLGAAQDVAEFLASITADAPNAAKKLGGKLYGESQRQIEKRVRALFSDMDAADEFMDYVNAEARISRSTGNISQRGSQTAQLMQSMTDVAGKGTLTRAAGTMVTALTDRARAGWTDAISDELANVALKGSAGGPELLAFLNSLRPHVPRYRPTAPLVAGQQAAQLP